MKKSLLAFAFVLLTLLPSHARALSPWQGLPMQTNSAAAGSIVLTGKQLLSVSVAWNAAVTARYLMVFDATSLPGNGATSTCSSSWVSGCMLYCMFIPNSTVAPSGNSFDFTVHPLTAKFGLVAAASTGAGCGTLTVDGANDSFNAQAQ